MIGISVLIMYPPPTNRLPHYSTHLSHSDTHPIYLCSPNKRWQILPATYRRTTVPTSTALIYYIFSVFLAVILTAIYTTNLTTYGV